MKIRMKSKIVLAGLVLMAAAGQAHAQSCSAGPRCSSADQKGQRAIAGYESRLQGASTHIASMVAYCTNMAVVEIAKVCEDEFRKAGNRQCAQIAADQARASNSSAQSALGSARASAAGANWSPNCNKIGGR